MSFVFSWQYFIGADPLLGSVVEEPSDREALFFSQRELRIPVYRLRERPFALNEIPAPHRGRENKHVTTSALL